MYKQSTKSSAVYMLNQALQIIKNMPEDANTLVLKNIINSVLNSQRIYMLYYNGEPLRLYTRKNEGDYCNEVSYHLTFNSCDPIWITNDVRIAAYNKYVSTDWYNSDYNQTCHEGIKAENIQIVDNFGNVYNRKPITNGTVNIIKYKIFNYGYLNRQLRKDPSYASLNENLYLLKQAKEQYQRKRLKYDVGLKACSLSDLQQMRKQLVKEKGEKVSQNKPYKRIQNKLDKVNKAIKNLGGM